MRTKFIRLKFLTGSPVQSKYLALLLVSMIAPLLFVGGCMYYLIFTIMAEQLGIPESIAYNLFPVIKKINLILLMGLPPIFAMLLAWGVALSHRFVGPLERLKNEIEKIAHSADYARRIKVRKGDDIMPIAGAINKLLDKIEGKAG